MSESLLTARDPFCSAKSLRIPGVCRAVQGRHGAGRGNRELSRRSGPQESKKLDRTAALAYATESMRLTTRLMQLASWLLLHRAVKEGEMSLAQANKEKTKVKLSLGDRDEANHGPVARAAARPDRPLAGLLDRVRRLDATMHSPLPDQPTAMRWSASSAC